MLYSMVRTYVDYLKTYNNLKKQKSGLIFDPKYYLSLIPSAKGSNLNPLMHWIVIGSKKNLNPHPLFDTSWYKATNLDVVAAGVNALEHYQLYGANEGRNPNPFFQSQWYMKTYIPDNNNNVNPLSHYIAYGAIQNLNPNAVFDSKWYRENHMTNELNSSNPLTHYLNYGRDPKISISPQASKQSHIHFIDLIDNKNYAALEQYYIECSQDIYDLASSFQGLITLDDDFILQYESIAKSGLFDEDYYADQCNIDKNQDLIYHYINTGAKSGFNPNPIFDTNWYLAVNKDVAVANINPLHHFIDHGWKENRDPHQLFQVEWYLKTYIEVQTSGVNPLKHFLDNSLLLRYDPNPLFKSDWYYNNYPEVRNLGIVPLVHYILYGSRGNFQPNSMFDVNWYLVRYPSVAAAGVDALAHYLRYGAIAQLDPSPNFSTKWYVGKYDDVKDSAYLPLEHYLNIGFDENRLSVDPYFGYYMQVESARIRLSLDIPEIVRHIKTMPIKVEFFVYVDGGYNDPIYLQDKLSQQIYDRWTLINKEQLSEFCGEMAANPNAAFLWIGISDELHPAALYEFARAINQHPRAGVIYSDEDELSIQGERVNPFFKPDWSPDYLESLNYIGNAACYRSPSIWSIIPKARSSYDLVLQSVEHELEIYHIRKILLHSKPRFTSNSQLIHQDKDDLRRMLLRRGRNGSVLNTVANERCFHIKNIFDGLPLVSIVIPTAGKTITIDNRSVDLIINCVDLIKLRSTYKNVEIIVVHNNDLSFEQIKKLKNHKVKLVAYDDPIFNVAKKLNIGADEATGEYLLLLNDDIEPLNADWIEELMGQLRKEHVGVVGAKLLYSDLKIQHAGVVTNFGNPDHVSRLIGRDDKGYFYSNCVCKNYSAVTGACMITKTDIYKAVGGYTEMLAVSYNDVDFCLKVRYLGYHVVYNPKAELVHFESKSRIPSLDLKESDTFHETWKHILESDPFYNEKALSIEPPTFEPDFQNYVEY